MGINEVLKDVQREGREDRTCGFVIEGRVYVYGFLSPWDHNRSCYCFSRHIVDQVYVGDVKQILHS